MKDLDKDSQRLERATGLISGFMLFSLYQISKAAGSNWDYDKPETMDIVVTKENADGIYGVCKEIRSNGYSIGVHKKGMDKIKEARRKAHEFLFEEANNPATPIERKIELVKLTSKT